LPAEGEYLRRDDDFFDEDFRLELADFLLGEDFFAELFFALVLLRALDFFELLFLAFVLLRALDFFALLDFFLAAFLVAITILPRNQMVLRFETVVWRSGNPMQYRRKK
jgi:hypothetical protein